MSDLRPAVVGIDPSLTGTAVCVWEPGRDEPSVMERFSSKPAAGVYGRIERYRKLAGCVISAIQPFAPAAILLEGYSFGSRGRNILDLAEFGGILRRAICREYATLREVSPSTLKKFATGKGQGPKELIIGHVAKRWGVLYETSDEADAYILARMARIVAGWEEPETTWQRDAVATVLNPPKKTRKKQQRGSE